MLETKQVPKVDEPLLLPAPDKYDREIGRLLGILEREGGVAFREEIKSSWTCAEPLFAYVSPSGSMRECDEFKCGCLTMVRNHYKVAYTDALTAAIRGDTRLPLLVDDITPQHLFVFAEWQRRIDRELGRS